LGAAFTARSQNLKLHYPPKDAKIAKKIQDAQGMRYAHHWCVLCDCAKRLLFLPLTLVAISLLAAW